MRQLATEYGVDVHSTEGGSHTKWALTVSGPGHKRAYPTQVKRLEQAEEMTRDLVAIMLDTEPDKIDADFCVRVADEGIARVLEATLRTRLTAELIGSRPPKPRARP